MKQNTLNALEWAINQGMDNGTIDFLASDLNITHKDYIGASESNGVHAVGDTVRAGLYIYTRNREELKFTPDTIFNLEDEDLKGEVVAYYQLLE